MAKPYDAATKFLIDLNPADWLRLAGITMSQESVEALDADLSTVSAAADRLIRVTDSAMPPRLYHLELQAGYDADMDERVHWYHALARREYKTPVRSIVFLLRPAADGPRLRGGIQEIDGAHELTFRYTLIRLWHKTPEELLSGGLATLPLAPLTVRSEPEAAPIVQRIQERLDSETDTTRARELWAATYILMGLTFAEPAIERLLRGVREMRESVTYQKIFEEGAEKGRLEGRAAEARRNLLLMGTKRLGEPDDATRTSVLTASVEQVEGWMLALFDVESWSELLASAA